MEVIGGIKAENLLIKSEADEDEENIVEIRADDIQDDIKKGSEAWTKPITLDCSENKTSCVDIEKKNITKNNQQYTKSDGVKVEKEEDSETKTVQEKLIMNCTRDLPQESKSHTKKKAVKRLLPLQKTIKKKFNKSLMINDKTKFVALKEYSKKHISDKKIQYHCNHCHSFVTTKWDIRKHIRDNHRDTIIFLNEEKELKNWANKTANNYVTWFEYILEDGDRYRCNHCRAIIQGQEQVIIHINEKHRVGGVKLNQCPYCPKQTLASLKSHILHVHTDEKDITYFRCDKCDFKAKTQGALNRHVLDLHTDPYNMLDKMRRCPHCPKMFKGSKHIKRHILHVHNPDSVEKLKCFHCSYESKLKISLINHIHRYHRKIEDLETLQCSQCTYKTKFKVRLHAHVNSAHNKQVLQCHVCSYQCTGTEKLKLHLIGHKKDKDDKDWKYRCDTCDYKTYRLYSLQIHKLKHLKPEEIQYFYCYHCDFKTKRKDNLKSHIFRHNKKDEGFWQCYICDFTAKKQDQFVRHIDMHSEDSNETKRSKTRVIRATDEPLKEVKMNRHSKGKKPNIT